ncbi:odorant receptor 2a-like isoform X4 [Cylas formicarius]|uniref:odorant receptor 2a-like isoform X4 n=1 Tax=Cylas formicarius TaxID=197179 RepID=UPI002958A123|nr:odorant receptor 2a-like isoform X4 [Cylas formicarius]
MAHYSYKNYYQTDLTALKFLACWVDVKPNQRVYYKFYFLLTNIILVTFYNLILTLRWIFVTTNLKEFAEMGYVAINCLMGQTKMLVIFRNSSYFDQLIAACDDNIFQPRNIKELAIIRKVLRNFAKTRRVLKTRPYMLPVPAWYPTDCLKSPAFEIAYLHQGISIMYLACSNLYVDVLMAGFATFIGLQCDLLCARLKAVGAAASQTEKKINFIDCILHYNSTFEFLKTTEKVFGKIYFGQLFASTTALCMDLFLLSLTEPKTFEFFYLVVYLLAVANLLLVPCWFSTEMTRKSENIPFAAYSCDWVDSSNSFKKELIFFIRRAQRPLKFYAVDFFEISVETFVKIIRTSLSYYAVLNNLNMEEKYY